jgi:uncharacterized protein (DUF2235 family)
MSKIIVFCADGTWNGPGQDENHDRVADPTNVFKLFANLEGVDAQHTTRLADEQEKTLEGAGGSVRQVAKYLHGVGDSDNFLVKAVGGAGGAGLITRVVRGYTFVSRSYADGDRIVLVGFSRGAYTARALAGLIAARGLLDGTKTDLADKESAYRLGSAEWFEYRRRVLRSKQSWITSLQEMVFDLPGFVSRPPTAPRIADVPIEAVAVWDTVGSLGIPTYNLEVERTDAFQFADTVLSDKVRHGLHAVAVDERRGDFTPTLWDASPRLVQVLFPGSHSDVGGGYPQLGGQSGLSDGGLAWMSGELTKLGVAFRPDPPYLPKPDACGPLHQIWLQIPWKVLPQADRLFASGLTLHHSVVERLGCPAAPTDVGSGPYGPANLGPYLADRRVIADVAVV